MIAALISALFLGAAANAGPPSSNDAFGSDVSVGYAMAQISTDALQRRSHGSALFRLDTFIQDRNYEGPQLGLGVWGQMSIKPKPSILTMAESGGEAEESIDLNHAGIAVVFRQAANAPLAGTFGIGFGRLEMSTESRAKTGLPAFTVEAGMRTNTIGQGFVDIMGRVHWVTAYNSSTNEDEDWWFIELATLIGGHVR